MTQGVLVVDDSLTVRMDLTEALQAAGLRAFSCASLADARDTLAREAVAAVVLDVLLPDGNGVDLLVELRASARYARVPVLMLSSEAEVRDRVRALQVGADDYVGKPYDAGYVVARLRELLGQRRQDQDGGTVLVIDDSTTFREALREALVAAGHRVLTATTGEEGLRLAADRRPAAIVVDGVMPGIDGTTVIRRIRLDAALRSTPCLLLTASEDGGAELRALEAGADAFVRKESGVELILARLAAVLRQASSGPAPDATSLSGPKKILAVDDSVTYLHGIEEALRGEGYDVVLACSGEEALDLLAFQNVDCVLLDLMMPGLGGRETCRRIKAAPGIRDTPLVMLTALEDSEAMIDSLASGADDFISKSSDIEVLKARVRAQLRRKQFEDEHRRVRDALLRKEIEATEARAARALAETRATLVEELERKNRELEAFSYSVSHDLRAPLRSIDGFSQALMEDCADALDDRGREHLRRVRAAAQRMGELIDDMLELSRVSRAELRRERVDLVAIARAVAAELQRREPERDVELVVAQALGADADPRLLRVVFENLLGNAWKFTRHEPRARVEIGVSEPANTPAFFVRDNGAGFDMRYAAKLFRPFQRLHSEHEFPGTGIGLATVQRIVDRHGGRVWAEGEVRRGAAVFFTLPEGGGT